MVNGLYKKIKNGILKARVKTASNKVRIEFLRSKGAAIGENCLIFTIAFSTEPYLISIGNHVVVSAGTTFITHDGAVWIFREKYPNLTIFGRIIIGNNTFIGMNCTILAGTEIGSNCIIGAGSVVRGNIPDNSVVMGNPAKVIMKTSIIEMFMIKNKNRIDTKHMNPIQRKEALMKHFFPNTDTKQ